MLYLNSRPVSLDTRKYSTARPVFRSRQGLVSFRLSTFEIGDLFWGGSSFIITEFRTSTAGGYALLGSFNKPSGVNFCLAVRWLDSDGLVVRYKLWSDVGEILNYPLYGGQSVGPNFVFEIWTSEDFSVASLSADYYVRTGQLVNPSDCCDDPSNVEETTYFPNLFVDQNGDGEYDLPLTPTSPYLYTPPSQSGSGLITEEGEGLVTEDGAGLILE